MLNENLIKICPNFANFRSLKRIFTFIFKANNEKKATLQGVHIPKHCQHYPPQLSYRSAGEMKKKEKGGRGAGVRCQLTYGDLFATHSHVKRISNHF